MPKILHGARKVPYLLNNIFCQELDDFGSRVQASLLLKAAAAFVQGNPYAAGITDETYVFGAKVKVKDVLLRFTDFIRNFYEDESSITDAPKYIDLLRQVS